MFARMSIVYRTVSYEEDEMEIFLPWSSRLDVFGDGDGELPPRFSLFLMVPTKKQPLLRVLSI